MERHAVRSVRLSASSTMRPWNMGVGLGDGLAVAGAGRRFHRVAVAGELGDVRIGHARDGEPAASVSSAERTT